MAASSDAGGTDGFTWDAAGNRIGVDSVVGGVTSSQQVTLAPDSNRILKLRAKGGNLPTDTFYAVGSDDVLP